MHLSLALIHPWSITVNELVVKPLLCFLSSTAGPLSPFGLNASQSQFARQNFVRKNHNDFLNLGEEALKKCLAKQRNTMTLARLVPRSLDL